MTDYNDGKWHGWNGGECPVDPHSRVEGIEASGTKWEAAACQNEWRTFRGAFRVTKPAPPKPREWWFCVNDCSGFAASIPTHVEGSAERSRQPGQSVIHVREVLPE